MLGLGLSLFQAALRRGGGGGGGPSFGPILDLDASSGVITTDGVIDSWLGSNETAFAAVGVGAARPTLGEVDGVPVVQFGGAHELDIPGFAVAFPTTGYTIFMRLKTGEVGITNRALFDVSKAATGAGVSRVGLFSSFVSANASITHRKATDAAGSVVNRDKGTPTGNDNVWQTIVGYSDEGDAAPLLRVGADSAQFPTSPRTLDYGFDAATIGARKVSGASDAYGLFALARLLVYNYKLSESEITAKIAELEAAEEPAADHFSAMLAGGTLASQYFTRGTPRPSEVLAGDLRTLFGFPTTGTITNYSDIQVHDGSGETAEDWTIKILNRGTASAPMLDVASPSQIALQNYYYNTQDNTVATGNPADVADSPGPLWRALIAAVEARVVAERPLDAFIFSGMNADVTTDATRLAKFETALSGLFAAVRTTNGTPDLPVFILKLQRNMVGAEDATENIRNAQRNVAASMSRVFAGAEEYPQRHGAQSIKTGAGITSGSNVVTLADTSGIAVNAVIEGPGIPNGAYVSSLVTNTSITLVRRDGVQVVPANATATNASATINRLEAAALYPGVAQPLDSAGGTEHNRTDGYYAVVKACARRIANIFGVGGVVASEGPTVGTIEAFNGGGKVRAHLIHGAGTDFTVGDTAPWRVTLDGVNRAINGVMRIDNQTVDLLLSEALLGGTTLSVQPAYGAMQRTGPAAFLRDNSALQLPMRATNAMSLALADPLDGAGEANPAFIFRQVDPVDRSMYTFDASGVVAPAGKLAVLIGYRSSTFQTLTLARLSGRPMCVGGQVSSATGGINRTAICVVDHPGGALGSLEVFLSGMSFRCGVAIVELGSVNSFQAVRSIRTSVTNGESINLEVPPGGAVVAYVVQVHTSLQQVTWGGGLVKNFDEAMETVVGHSGASLVSEAGGTIAVSCTVPVTPSAGNGMGVVYAVFGPGDADVVGELLWRDGATADLSTYTFSDKPLGDEAPDRRIALLISGRGSAFRRINSATLTRAGHPDVPMDLVVDQRADGSLNNIAVYDCLAPEGTLGDFTVTFSGVMTRAAAAGGQVLNAEDFVAGISYGTIVRPPSLLRVMKGGYALGYGMLVQSGGGITGSWDGLTEEFSVEMVENVLGHTAASGSFVADEQVSDSQIDAKVTWSATPALGNAQVEASWRPKSSFVPGPGNVMAALRAGGVNLAFGWYTNGDWRPNQFQGDLPLIYAHGGRHVRLPIGMNVMEDGTTGNLREDRWRMLKKFVSAAIREGLVTIIDLHNTFSADWQGGGFMGALTDAGVRTRHISLMTQIAEHINDELDLSWVVFQPFNEPIFNTGNSAVWYNHQDILIPAIQAVAPTMWLFCGAHEWQNLMRTRVNLQAETRPWYGPKIIVDCHYYRPNPLSHCQLDPNSQNNCPGKTWPGVYNSFLSNTGVALNGTWDKSVLESDINGFFDYADLHGLRIHFSEIGTSSALEDGERSKYLNDLIDVIQARNGGWSIWEWNNDGAFGIKNSPLTLAVAMRGNPPTVLNPGDDVNAIVQAAPEGTTFSFNAGTYRTQQIVPKNNQKFVGRLGAVLNGSEVLTGWTADGDDWWVGGQTQQGQRQFEDHPAPGAMRAGYPETCFRDNVPLLPADSRENLASGYFYLDYDTDRVYVRDDPAGHVIEAGKRAFAFDSAATGVTIQNFVIEKYNAPAQHGAIHGRQNWTIINNEVRLNYGVGIYAEGGSIIQGNYTHNNGNMGIGTGLEVGGEDDILVENNEIASNGAWSGIDVFWEGGGTKFRYSNGLIVRGNYVHDNIGYGLWTDIDNINSLIEYNVCINNSGGGLVHEISYAAVIRYNILMNNGASPQGAGWVWGANLQIQNSKNVEAYGNMIDYTIAGNGFVLIYQNRGGDYTVTGNNVHDNIFVSEDGLGRLGGSSDFDGPALIAGGNIWADNSYFMPAAESASERFIWGAFDWESFATFKTKTGETGILTQDYPDTAAWLVGSAADPSKVYGPR